MKPIFAELTQEFSDRVEFETIDVDTDVEKANRYEVMSVPAFILEKDGREVERLVGAHSKEELVTLLNKHLV